MPFADVNGLRVHYELHGHAGEPLVLVHGYTGDVSDWDYQVEEFARDYRVLLLDNRGHGQSEAPAELEAYTVELMVEDTLAVIAVAAFEKYHLVGHSMGGAVAQEIALRHPDRLFSLTLRLIKSRSAGAATGPWRNIWRGPGRSGAAGATPTTGARP